MRLLGLDLGGATIGVAVSDPLGITAQGICTLHRRTHRKDMAALKLLVEKYETKAFVLGLPLNLDGSRGPAVDKVESFADHLRREFALPVYFQDERLTTVAAHKTLLENDTSRQKRRQVVDKLAAVLILQTYLDNPNTIK
ncbi:MAG TPA: Holliday junction resolvase RuvX [Candidatus Avidehalobacter gallistercoris]|uniref:Putative pre-16S rRNA nuclease n=1 Tax=Candidatus Avidehalobacter gallistercoris TaxID=2840694 RepID=A0A9D1HJG2_9FIRM|nr:Holliday junction resolvase RuvX [Candidatus Avidehalobacter gallistercoris]